MDEIATLPNNKQRPGCPQNYQIPIPNKQGITVGAGFTKY